MEADKHFMCPHSSKDHDELIFAELDCIWCRMYEELDDLWFAIKGLSRGRVVPDRPGIHHGHGALRWDRYE